MGTLFSSRVTRPHSNGIGRKAAGDAGGASVSQDMTLGSASGEMRRRTWTSASTIWLAFARDLDVLRHLLEKVGQLSPDVFYIEPTAIKGEAREIGQLRNWLTEADMLRADLPKAMKRAWTDSKRQALQGIQDALHFVEGWKPGKRIEWSRIAEDYAYVCMIRVIVDDRQSRSWSN